MSDFGMVVALTERILVLERDFMDSLSPEQQALFASIMGNSSQAKAVNPTIPTPVAPAAAPAPAPAAPSGGDSNRVLSQAEIDALIASMAG